MKHTKSLDSLSLPTRQAGLTIVSLVALSLLTIGLIACGDSTTTALPPAPTPSVVASSPKAVVQEAVPTNMLVAIQSPAAPGTAMVQVGSQQIDVCSLVTKAEVEAVFGEPAQGGYFTKGLASCNYYPQSTATSKSAGVTVVPTPPDWATLKTTNSTNTTYQDVSGVGSDNGFAVDEMVGPVLYVHKGAVTLKISIGGIADGVGAEKKLALLALGRLP